MEKNEIVVALIRHVDEQILWLAQHNGSHRQMEFVVGRRLEGEQKRETVSREVSWALGLNRNSDFLVSSMAQLNLEFVDTLPGQSGPTHNLVSFYNVEIYRTQVIDYLHTNDELVWLSSKEICQGKTQDGIPIDPLLIALNKRGNVIQHWESRR
jgi:hypothetical protein